MRKGDFSKRIFYLFVVRGSKKSKTGIIELRTRLLTFLGIATKGLKQLFARILDHFVFQHRFDFSR
jgi:hypothetical protein